MAVSVAIENEEHWHKLRAENVGASEVAALFGASPYTTRFTLWHQKAGKIAAPEFNSERMEWGNLLEPVIAKGISNKQGWQVQKVRRYLTHKTIKGMGASLDYEIINHPDGVGCLEIKNISIEAFRSNWLKNEDGSYEAPLHIELQLQHQLAVTGRPWGAIGLLVGGNESHVVIRKRHEPTIQKIEATVAAFWESIEKGEAPHIENAGDLAAVEELFSGKQVVSFENSDFEKAAELYIKARENMKVSEANLEECKASLIAFLDLYDAEVGVGNGYKVSYKEQTKKEHVVKESKFRVLRVSQIKQKGNNE
jgi:putative phage-type endonuclease